MVPLHLPALAGTRAGANLVAGGLGELPVQADMHTGRACGGPDQAAAPAKQHENRCWGHVGVSRPEVSLLNHMNECLRPTGSPISGNSPQTCGPTREQCYKTRPPALLTPEKGCRHSQMHVKDKTTSSSSPKDGLNPLQRTEGKARGTTLRARLYGKHPDLWSLRQSWATNRPHREQGRALGHQVEPASSQ